MCVCVNSCARAYDYCVCAYVRASEICTDQEKGGGGKYVRGLEGYEGRGERDDFIFAWVYINIIHIVTYNANKKKHVTYR